MNEHKILLKKLSDKISGVVSISSSKSESNRLLVINALASKSLELKNLSEARDTQTMIRLLDSDDKTWDVKDAGTTMRFLTAFLAVHGKGHVITGTERMKQRPIGPLVEALRSIGADVGYQENEGYPPLRITGLSEQQSSLVQLPGNISSQYISALLMIAPCLPDGLTLELTTEIFSRPYIQMTLKLMGLFGIEHDWVDRTIQVNAQEYNAQIPTYVVESDWSGSSYWFALVAMSDDSELFLPNLRQKSTQGDQAIHSIMSKMGVKTEFVAEGIRIHSNQEFDKEINLDFRECPDLAQTVMVVASVKGITLKMTGLESLKIKETDRVQAMMNELKKLGADLEEHDGTWTLIPSDSLPDHIEVETYEDHRMAMAFAPLCCLMEVEIKEPKVVNKSYPGFWEEMAKFS